jgi:DNA-binding Lrp family transcriptional regulator
VRAEIEKYLDAAKEASAKRIAERIGMPHLDVAKELNRMHADGVIEREKRKGAGNEYLYWLARGDAVKTSTTPVVPESVDLAAPSVIAPSDLASSGATLEVALVKRDPEQALSKLATDLRELLEIFGLPPTMIEAKAAARTMLQIAKATSIERDELRAELESQRSANARLKTNNAVLEQRIDELTLGPVGSKSPLFVTVGRYAKAQRHDSLEKAQKRGQRLVRGEKESEVLVLEPVGRIVRGTEWQPRR